MNQIIEDDLSQQVFLPKVSVVVPIYNGAEDLPDLINCLCHQNYPNDRVEYLLVDNGSRDRTNAIIQAAAQDAKNQGITILSIQENQIQSSYAARNAGIRVSKGEIVAFTDVDCRPQIDWVYELVQPFADPTIGVVGGAIVALQAKTLIEKYAEFRDVLSHKGTVQHSFCAYAAGANLAIRRQTLEQVGLFRSYLTTGGDADICWRIQRQSSWRFCCTERAIVKHRHRASLAELRKQFRRYGCSHQYLEELYGVPIFPNHWNTKDHIHSWGRWLIKELPPMILKYIVGKATFLDLLATPLDLLVLQAEFSGRRAAKLPEKAWQQEWL